LGRWRTLPSWLFQHSGVGLNGTASRDGIRKFLKGRVGDGTAATRFARPYAWAGRAPATSINFITAHDGFTLADVSYNGHNQANGENNDGTNDNDSWNWNAVDRRCGDQRRQRMKNAVAMLIISQGGADASDGDEVGRSQHGNNNTC